MSLSITITANGKPHTALRGKTVADFLRTVGQKPGLVVVEYNGLPLTSSEAEKQILANGDHLEIVRIVAGG